jgi:DNA-binding NtrC family response regulator
VESELFGHVGPEALAILQARDCPLSVGELQQVVETAVFPVDRETVRPEDAGPSG